jgi:hypothetical protein
MATLEPKIKEAVARIKNETELEYFARAFIGDIASIAMPKWIVEFKPRFNPQEERKEELGFVSEIEKVSKQLDEFLKSLE